jgi:D-alanine transaminase
MPEIAYINGEFCPVDQAQISVRDRGFIFGDGVYDVAKIKYGEPFQVSRHVDRLCESARALEFDNIPEPSQLRETTLEVYRQSNLEDGMLYMQLTRGVAPRQSVPPEDIEPTVFISAEQTDRGADHYRKSGAGAIFVDDIRWARNDIKTINLLPKVLQGTAAKRKDGCYEGLYRDDNGYVWEGTSTNLYMVRGDTIVTPPKSSKLLPGITRENVFDIADRKGLSVEESDITDEELLKADEVFISGTLTEILGITEIEGNPIGDGDVGPVTQQIYSGYLALYES